VVNLSLSVFKDTFKRCRQGLRSGKGHAGRGCALCRLWHGAYSGRGLGSGLRQVQEKPKNWAWGYGIAPPTHSKKVEKSLRIQSI